MLTKVFDNNTSSRYDGRRSVVQRPCTRVIDGHPPIRPSRANIEAPLHKAFSERQAEIASDRVEISAAADVKRNMVGWPGVATEIVQANSRGRMELSFRGGTHLLVFYEHGLRCDGETCIEGRLRLQNRKLTSKFLFVPAGHIYTEWHQLSAPMRVAFFYLDQEVLLYDQTRCVRECPLTYRLFEDATLQSTANKLIRSIERLDADQRNYVEALGHVLVHELRSLCNGGPRNLGTLRGGLAAWQERVLSTHIDEHLTELIPLSRLASLVGLSTYHCCRAFKKSFGAPPRRYQTNRRIDLAKILLADSTLSVTNIGMAVGFGETSAFSIAFRRATGWTPSAYRRNVA